ncbi:MAG: aminoglycoside adenylyltransferase domain-containing protein [bacterium]
METAFPTPYSELNEVLRDLVDSAREVLSENFVGAYLQGSFATGGFDIHSDVDFIIVVETELSDDQVAALQMVHERLYNLDTPWAQHLEGSYFPRSVLRRHTQQGEKLWYLDNGSRSLIKADHCNSIVVRWVVRENGVTLAGPSPDTLVDPICVEELRREIAETMAEWGQEILDNQTPFNNRFYQTFIVLSYCRMLHDLCTGFPGSKRAGAEWAKTHLEQRWNRLIDRTWSGRPNPALSVWQLADPEDFESTLQFVRYVVNESQQYVTPK